jgi:hypothetical protein
MSKAKDEMRAEYRPENLGRGVKGEYLGRLSRGTNLVPLDDQVAEAFPMAEAAYQAPVGLPVLTDKRRALPIAQSARPASGPRSGQGLMQATTGR